MALCIECDSVFESPQWNQKRCYTCTGTTRLEKDCKSCGETFHPRTNRQVYCNTKCNKEGWQEQYLQRAYGISKEDYDKMYLSQNGLCAICDTHGFRMNEKVKNGLCVDHDHETGEVRGLLCHNCNRALGLLQDDPKLIEKSLQYLSYKHIKTRED
jgi:hypothetical protein